ncbi:MAG: hypothetical protein KGI49_01900 [Patescibacteria group bacterium]|nr:hypothetical protein [Patescibacteria group bacterium]
MNIRSGFAGKRIAVVGLGPHGEMAENVKFLAKMNALVSVYDLRSEARIQSIMTYVRSFGLANYVCGSVPAEDLIDMDLIILSHEYAKTASFLSEARRKEVPIEYPETLLLKSAPPVAVVAVMGSCGKATVMSMLAPMLEAACAVEGNQSLFVADPESSEGSLSHLKRMKNGDLLVMRLTESVMPEVGNLDWSPFMAIFTTVPAAGSYRSNPFEILGHQTYNNYIIGEDAVIDAVKSSGIQPKAKMLRTKASLLPDPWLLNGRGEHDKMNAALALQAAKVFKVSDEAAEAALSRWRPLKGRLEPIKKVKGVEFYNDSASVSPLSTIAGMTAMSKDRSLVVIIGGAATSADYRELYAALPTYAHTLITIPGSGTLRERQALSRLGDIKLVSAPSIEEAVRLAMDNANKGDKVLFSPGFGAIGIDPSRQERGERFVRAVRGL